MLALYDLFKNPATIVSTSEITYVEKEQFTSVTKSFQATVVGTGVVTATVVIEVSNGGSHWVPLLTFTLSGTTSATDLAQVDAFYGCFRANVTAVTGTGAAVTAVMLA